MIDGLRPYAEMKQTGLPWLGEVPQHWDVRRNGRLFGARRETGFPELPVLEVSISRGVRIRDFDGGGRKQEMADRSKYQRAVRGDIAYNMMRMWQGAVGIAPADGLVSPAYVVARPFPETGAEYYAYLFRTAAYMRETDVYSRGIVPDRNRLYWESFKQMPSAYPPIDEQRLIVRFLDWHGAQAAKLIRAKKKLIALLNEQTQNIIDQAITRGLDSNSQLKPSGIHWLGDVPEGWTLKRFKYLTKIRNGQVDPRRDEYKSQVLIAPNHIHSGTGQILKLETASDQGADSGKYKVMAGEIIYSKIRPNLRKAAISPLNCLCSADMYPIAIRTDELLPAYFLRIILSMGFTKFAVDCSMRVAMPKINREALSEYWICYPSLTDQMRILDSIADSTILFTRRAEAAEREIAFVREFHSRLIADVVTGKLDVRAVATGLPEIIEFGTSNQPPDDEEAELGLDEAEAEELAA